MEKRWLGLLYETVTDSLFLLSVEPDECYRFVSINEAFIQTTGLTRQQIINKRIEQVIPETAHALVLGRYRDALRENTTVSWEEVSVYPKGRRVGEVKITPLLDEATGKLYLAGLVHDITPLREEEEALRRSIAEREAVEEALRQSEARYRAMIEHGSDIISIHDAEGQMLYQSPSIKHILGYEQDELVGKNVLDYIHPEQKAHAEAEINKVRHSPGVHPSFETRFRSKDGDWVWLECVGTNLLDEPNIGKILCNARDITERKLAEDALRASEAELRALFAAMIDVIFVIDSEGRHLKVAPTNPDILYRPPGKIVGKSLHDIFPEPTADLFLDYIRAALATRNQMSVEYSLNIKGQEMWFVATIAPMTEQTVVWVARDITNIKQAERALRESENLYRETVENANDIIYTLELNGRYISVNRAGERITGYTRDEIRQMTFADLIAPEHLDFVRQKVREKLISGGETTYELEIIAKDKRRIAVEVNSRLLEEKGVPIAVLGIARDITERKRAEEKLWEIEEQLRQSQKLESIGLLAGGIAHDFNNMLTAITGYSELILRQLKADDPLRHKVEEIKKAGERAGALTHQLLAFSRKQILQLKTLDLNDIISDVAKMLQRVIGEDIDLKTVLNKGIGQVKIDPGQITQVLMNLAVNARDAMPSGGKLTIETSNVNLDGAYADLHVAVTPGRYVMLAVSDTGTGMDAETQQRIFEPFFTTKEVGKGTGMGLATVYGVVKQSGGNIWVYSEVGHGTTFKIYLPQVVEEAKGIKEQAPEMDLPTGTEKILLVEDEDLVRDLTRQVLELCGYTVLEASDGADALKLCEEEACDIDLLITDVVMPKMGGQELAKRLAESRPSLRVLFFSGYTDNAIVHHGVLDEGTNFIQKPFTPEAFALKVREVLDS